MTALVVAGDLKRSYEIRQGWFRKPAHLHAVGGISFELDQGRTLAVVGESGCGKSTLARLVTLIEEPTAGTLALDGIDAVYHIGPGANHTEQEMGDALIEAATRTGVEHVVLSSVLHPIIPILQHLIKRDLEVQLIESGLNFTVLKPCDFMMPEQYSLPAFEAGIFPAFWPLEEPRRGSLIALDDLTDVAAKVIKEGAHHYFASYELVGPDKLTASEVADTLSRVTGKHVTAVEWKPDDMLQHMFGDDRTSPEAQHQLSVISSVSQWYGKHSFIGNSNVLAWLLGRAPTSYQEFVTKAFTEYQSRTAVAE